MKTLRTCSVYFRSEGAYVFGFRNTRYGWIKNVPGMKLPAGPSAEMVGLALVSVLEGQTEEIVDVDLQAAGKEYADHLKCLGFKSVHAFERAARLVGVEVRAGEVKVVPYEPANRGGFVPITSPKRVCALDAAALGSSVISALDDCGI